MKDAIVLHHTGDADPGSQFGKVLAFHDAGAPANGKRKWPKGHGIQYGHFIEKPGLHIQAKDDGAITWHAGNDAMNKRSVAVCLAGDFTREAPTAAQLDALVRAVTDIQTRWGIPDSRIFLHREVRKGGTQCPGVDLRALLLARRGEMLAGRVPALRRALERLRDGARKIRLTRLLDRLTKRGG